MTGRPEGVHPFARLDRGGAAAQDARAEPPAKGKGRAHQVSADVLRDIPDFETRVLSAKLWSPLRYPDEATLRADCSLFHSALAPRMSLTRDAAGVPKEALMDAIPWADVDAFLIMGNNDLKQVSNVARAFLALPPTRQTEVMIYISGKGGHGTVDGCIFGHSEAETMKRWLMSLGVPEDRIVVETKATNSGENVKLLSPLIPRESSVFVMSGTPAGIFRQMRTFGKQWDREGTFYSLPPPLEEYFSSDPTLESSTEILLLSFLREMSNLLHYTMNGDFVTKGRPHEPFFPAVSKMVAYYNTFTGEKIDPETFTRALREYFATLEGGDTDGAARIKDQIGETLKKMRGVFCSKFAETEEIFMRHIPAERTLGTQHQRLMCQERRVARDLDLGVPYKEVVGHHSFPLDMSDPFEKIQRPSDPHAIQLSPESMQVLYTAYREFLDRTARKWMPHHDSPDFMRELHERFPEGFGTFSIAEARRIKGLRPRAEVRKVGDSAVQFALSFPDGALRERFVSDVLPTLMIDCEYSCNKAGSTTLELAPKGVDKALPLRYLAHRASHLFTEMGVKRGPLLVADADGTLWEKPEKGVDPLSHGLEGAIKEQIVAFLEKGGVLVVNSGNDFERVTAKVSAGLRDRPELLQRIAVFGCGGSTLHLFGEGGAPREIVDYRLTARSLLGDGAPATPQEELAWVYVGDDHKLSGNDAPPFQYIGPERSVCVSDKGPKDFGSHLKGARHYSGFQEGTARFLKEVNARLKAGVLDPFVDGGHRLSSINAG